MRPHRAPVVSGATLCFLLLATSGCRTTRNYTDPAGPRWAAPVPARAVVGRSTDTLRFATFNVRYGERIDSAIAVIRAEPALHDADVLLLQEMDAEGTRRIAELLGMGFVYYPAGRRLDSGRDWGNAVLSRWPIVEDAKVLLPGIAPFGRTRRTATAATLQVGGRRVRVYSTHLGTPVNIGPEAQKAQFRAVLADARGWDHVVVGGDMNTSRVGSLARDAGYAWPTEEGPNTLTWGRWDHIFFRGLAIPSGESSGTILDVRGASDHRPVWAVGVL